MKVSYNWLKEFVKFDWSPDELAERLTMCGLEVEGIELFESIPGSLEGVVTGQVMSVVKHPDADKLRICQVNVGEPDLLTIVCGAPNVAENQKVVVALIGCTLHPKNGESFQIKKSKIRGQVSEGMICALDELGLGEDHSGIIVLDENTVVGIPAAEIFEVETDFILEVSITANRADATSHFGVARDIAAILGTKAKLPEFVLEKMSDPSASPINVILEDTDKCPRYAGIYIEGVEIKESPAWLKKRLSAIGLNSHNNVVDVTNFVLHELGQPLHAFDADEIAGNTIRVKTWDKDISFVTLDGNERKILAGKDLLICDGEKPVAIAGIMGGKNSEVSAKTKNIFLESAWFNPGTIRPTGRRLIMKTDASFRFERGVDPNITYFAACRAAQLIAELGGGKIKTACNFGRGDLHPMMVEYPVARANRLMGKEFSFEELKSILHCLDIEVNGGKSTDENLMLSIPRYRVDVTRPEDVMEEILRIYGQNNIAKREKIAVSLTDDTQASSWRLRQRYLDYLAANGWSEILTNPLIPSTFANENTVNLINNLSEDHAVMRDNLVHSGLEVIEYNHNRKNTDLRLFEFGKTYHRDGEGTKENEWLCWFITGNDGPTHWKDKPVKASYFLLKKELERLALWFGFEWKEVPLDDHSLLDYGLAIAQGENIIARFGRIRSSLLKGKDIKGEVFYAQADWKLLVKLNGKKNIRFAELSRFPSVRRDISMIVPENVSFSKIKELIKACNPGMIKEITIFDIYKGDKIEAGKKSYAVGITLLDEHKTLTDQTADKLMEKVFGGLEKELGVVIRK